jgi:hypothetical protein
VQRQQQGLGMLDEVLRAGRTDRIGQALNPQDWFLYRLSY